MTFEEWWAIGARLLGTYLLVLAGLYAAGALTAFGIGLPDGSNRLIVAGIPVLQGFVAAIGGLWLLRGSGRPPRTDGGAERSTGASVVPLQLLGIFLVVTGAAAVLGVVIHSYFVETDWQFRSADLVAGVIELGVGALLTFTPVRVARALHQFAR